MAINAQRQFKALRADAYVYARHAVLMGVVGRGAGRRSLEGEQYGQGRDGSHGKLRRTRGDDN